MHVSQRKLTVPNVLTLLRAAAIPWVFLLLRDNPGKYWWVAAVLAGTDNVDGMLARLEDRSKTFRALGFRRSEPGRRLDPLIDKLFMVAVLLAGLLAGVIPLWLGALSLVQKAAAAVVTLVAEGRRRRLEVSRRGKYGEFLSAIGIITLLASAAVVAAAPRLWVRLAAMLIALMGITLAGLATIAYGRTALGSGRKILP